MASAGAKAAAAGGIALAGAGLFTYWWFFLRTSAPECGGSGSPKNCSSSTSVGTAVVNSYPPTMPTNPTWIPCEDTEYALCATTNYSGTFDQGNSGTLTATSPSGTTATWGLAYSSLGDWIGFTTGASGDLQVYVIY